MRIGFYDPDEVRRTACVAAFQACNDAVEVIEVVGETPLPNDLAALFLDPPNDTRRWWLAGSHCVVTYTASWETADLERHVAKRPITSEYPITEAEARAVVRWLGAGRSGPVPSLVDADYSGKCEWIAAMQLLCQGYVNGRAEGQGAREWMLPQWWQIEPRQYWATFANGRPGIAELHDLINAGCVNEETVVTRASVELRDVVEELGRGTED